MNRDVGFFRANASIPPYSYSNQFQPLANSMPMSLETLMVEINERLGTAYNAVVVNRYNDKDDYISAHKDNEKGLKTLDCVATLSIGTERKFRVRDAKTRRIVCDALTRPYHLLIMRGADFQQHYTHEIPKQNVEGMRLSFTFREHKKK